MYPETNYEDMDDLALCDHIEWSHAQPEHETEELLTLLQN
jgi:hypothetical protein